MGSFRTMKSEAQREAQVDKILTLRRDSLIAGRNLARAEYEFHIEFRRRFISKRGMQRLIHIIRCVWVRKRLTSSQANTWDQDILPALEFRQTRDDLISHALLGMDSKSEPIPTKQHKR